jgi:hypothetical protein
LITDGSILKEARQAAFDLVKDDSKLEDPQNIDIKNHFEKHYSYLLKGMNFG